MNNLLEIWRRLETGEKVSENKFDIILSKKATQLKKDYKIHYDSSMVIPLDKSIWSDIFEAAVELLSTVGIFCYDTSTRIKLKEEEILDKIRKVPNKVIIGEGREKREYKSRSPDDNDPPLIGGGPVGCPVSEEIYAKVLSSYAKENIDALSTGLLISKSVEIKKDTPTELAAVTLEVSLAREALDKVNKPGLGIIGPSSGITATALNSSLSSKGMRNTDIHTTVIQTELKVDLHTLNRIYYLLFNEAILEVGQCPLIRYLGGPEETAIISVSEILLDFILGGTCAAFSPTSMSSSLSTEREALWVTAVTILATKKHFKPLIGNWIWAGAGPCTEMICYEIAAQTILGSVVGADMIISAGSTAGKQIDHYTGMEAKIARDTVDFSKRVNLRKANEIINELLKFYENYISSRKIPLGKSFKECYSLESLTPSAQYTKIWESIKDKISEIL